jgi:hypothetical protein
MFKTYGKITLQLAIGFALYYLLNYFIEDKLIVIAVLLSIVAIFLTYGILQSKNPADVLEIMIDYDRYIKHIERFKEDQNKYNLLKAYGLVHHGDYDTARSTYALITDTKQLEDKHLKFIDTAINLKFAYNADNLGLYTGIYTKAVEDGVFKEVNLHDDVFKVHLKMLERKYLDAEEVAKEVIPGLKKRIYIIELEYLLAKAYFEQNKLDDCSAVTEFVVDKGFNVVYTKLCEEMHQKVNRI